MGQWEACFWGRSLVGLQGKGWYLRGRLVVAWARVGVAGGKVGVGESLAEWACGVRCRNGVEIGTGTPFRTERVPAFAGRGDWSQGRLMVISGRTEEAEGGCLLLSGTRLEGV